MADVPARFIRPPTPVERQEIDRLCRKHPNRATLHALKQAVRNYLHKEFSKKKTGKETY